MEGTPSPNKTKIPPKIKKKGMENLEMFTLSGQLHYEMP
jgi:hypothetical protein